MTVNSCAAFDTTVVTKADFVSGLREPSNAVTTRSTTATAVASSTATTPRPSTTPATPILSSSSGSGNTIHSVSATSIPSAVSSSTATPTNGYYPIGCFADVGSGGHALPLLVANDSITPELCIAHANSLANAARGAGLTPHPSYLFLEYHRECYGGKTLDFHGRAVTSLVGPKACTDYCHGSVRTAVTTLPTDGGRTTTLEVKATGTANYCGGRGMFNLYALDATVHLPTTGGPMVTATAK